MEKNTIKSMLKRVKREIKIDENECWVWPGGLWSGYPHVHIATRACLVHKEMYKWFIGPIPKGAIIHHECEVKRCINPAHLEATTYHGSKHTKTHCLRGHKYTPENIVRSGSGQRYCRTCHNIHQRNYRKKIKDS